MLTWIQKLNEQLYDEAGNRRDASQQPSYDFNLFHDVPIPAPEAGKDVILLCCTNVWDGVGDFAHLKRYYQRVKALVGDAYKIQPVLQALKREDDDAGAIKDNANQDRVIQAYHELCSQEGLEPLLNLDEKDPKLQALVQQSAAIFDISYGNTGQASARAVPSLFATHCPELSGSGIATNLSTAFQLGKMGLKSESDPRGAVYGIDLDPYEFELEQAASRMTAFNSAPGRALMQHLLGEISPQSAKDYLSTHKLMPGYPQNNWAAQNFILSGILKNVGERGLNAPCDFILPRNSFDQEELLKHLKNLGLLVPIEVITPQGSTQLDEQSESPNKVRLFSGFFVDDWEYQHLYRIRTDLGLGSGDNTIAQVLSSEQLPFFQAKPGLIEFFLDKQLRFTAAQWGVEASDPSLKEKYKKLEQYFALQCRFVSQFYDEGSIFQNIEGPIQVHTPDRAERFYSYTREVAALAKDPDVLDAWHAMQASLKQDCDYNKTFSSILTGSLLLNHPNPTQTLDKTPAKQLGQVVDETFMAYHGLRQHYSHDEIMFLSSPHSKYLLIRLEPESPDELLALARLSGVSQSTFASLVEKIKKHEADTGHPYSKLTLRNLLLLNSLKLIDINQLPLPEQALTLDHEGLLSHTMDALVALNRSQFPMSPEERQNFVQWVLDFVNIHDERFANDTYSIIFKANRESFELLQILLLRPEITTGLSEPHFLLMDLAVQAGYKQGTLDNDTKAAIHQSIIKLFETRGLDYSRWTQDPHMKVFMNEVFNHALEVGDTSLASYLNKELNIDYSSFSPSIGRHPVTLAVSNYSEIRTMVWQSLASQNCYDQLPILFDIDTRRNSDYFIENTYLEAMDLMAKNRIAVDGPRLIRLAEMTQLNPYGKPHLAGYLLVQLLEHPKCLRGINQATLNKVEAILNQKLREGSINETFLKDLEPRFEKVKHQKGSPQTFKFDQQQSQAQTAAKAPEKEEKKGTGPKKKL